MTFVSKHAKTYHSIASNSFVELIDQYDELVSQGYTRSEYACYVPADDNNSAQFIISMFPPKVE